MWYRARDGRRRIFLANLRTYVQKFHLRGALRGGGGLSTRWSPYYPVIRRLYTTTVVCVFLGLQREKMLKKTVTILTTSATWSGLCCQGLTENASCKCNKKRRLAPTRASVAILFTGDHSK